MNDQSSFRRGGAFVVLGYGTSALARAAHQVVSFHDNQIVTHVINAETTMFFCSTHRDVAENEECLVVNLGWARDKATGQLLSAHDLLVRAWVSPEKIAVERLTGNNLILVASKVKPVVSVFRGVVSTAILFYHQSPDGFIVADRPRLLYPLMRRLELLPEALVSHFLFRGVPSPAFYLRDLQRVEHGHLLTWSRGTLESKLVQDLRLPVTQMRVDDSTVAAFLEQIKKIATAYVKGLSQRGWDHATLLSGGVDSSVMQYLINQGLPSGKQPHSISYAMRVPGFEREIEYARSASRALKTHHHYVDLVPEDYPDLLQRMIEGVGMPIAHESEPCGLGIVEFIAHSFPQISVLFDGDGADTLHGTGGAKQQLQLDRVKDILGADWGLQLLARVLNPIAPHKAVGARNLARLWRSTRNIHSPEYLPNAQGLFTDFELAQKCFGTQAVTAAMQSFRDKTAQYTAPHSMVEWVHYLQLVTLIPDQMPLMATLVYNLYGRSVVCLYLDYEFIQATAAFDPRVRYYSHGRNKPILKRILERYTAYEQVNKPKGDSGFDKDLRTWMKTGCLAAMVHSIERPAFMERAAFESKIDNPDWFTWNLLTLDLFQKRVLANIKPFAG